MCTPRLLNASAQNTMSCGTMVTSLKKSCKKGNAQLSEEKGPSAIMSSEGLFEYNAPSLSLTGLSLNTKWAYPWERIQITHASSALRSAEGKKGKDGEKSGFYNHLTLWLPFCSIVLVLSTLDPGNIYIAKKHLFPIPRVKKKKQLLLKLLRSCNIFISVRHLHFFFMW